MYSKIKLLGHPIHPMLVGFPVTLYTATLVAYLVFANGRDPFWFHVGLAANIAGVGMALITAVPGFLDWLIGIPAGHAAKGTGLKHMLLNVTALIVFAANAWLHLGYWNTAAPDPTLAIALALIGIVITIGAGWLGWNLVQKHHVGVEMVEPTTYEDRSRLRPVA
jgi:uncharacterized membrane protein